MLKQRLCSLFAGLALIVGTTTVLPAQSSSVTPGIRIGSYFDPTNFYVGGELLFPLSSAIYLNPNLEYVFIDNGTFATFNIDAHYDFPVSDPAYVWFGLGLGLLYSDPEGTVDADITPGLNILLGLGFDAGPVTPYTQFKATMAETNQFSLGFGVRF